MGYIYKIKPIGFSGYLHGGRWREKGVKNDSLVIGLSHRVVPCGEMRNTGEEQMWSRKSRFCFDHIGLSFLLDIQGELAIGC